MTASHHDCDAGDWPAQMFVGQSLEQQQCLVMYCPYSISWVSDSAPQAVKSKYMAKTLLLVFYMPM